MTTPTPTATPIPLTTTFIPPPDCTTDSYHVEWSAGSNYYTLPPTATGIWWWMSLGARDWSTCFPSGYATTSYFSPGVCPSGYSAGGLSYVSLDGKTETRATCCPTNYNPQTGTDWPWYADNPCTSSNADPNSVYTYTQDGTLASQTGTFGINAKGISIRWQPTDFITPTSSPSSPTSSSTSTGTATATTNPTNTAPSNNTLSTGAKAGIGVGVAVGAIMVVIIAFLVYRLRRTSKNVPARAPVSESELGTGPERGPMSVSETSYLSRGNAVPVELDSRQGHTELDSQQGVGSSGLSEMDTSPSVVEMDAHRQQL